MTKPLDKDIKALSQAVRALNQSSCQQMLQANLQFLVDYFLWHPSSSLPKHLQNDKWKEEKVVQITK
jgi:hypothetical protein